MGQGFADSKLSGLPVQAPLGVTRLDVRRGMFDQADVVAGRVVEAVAVTGQPAKTHQVVVRPTNRLIIATGSVQSIGSRGEWGDRTASGCVDTAEALPTIRQRKTNL